MLLIFSKVYTFIIIKNNMILVEKLAQYIGYIIVAILVLIIIFIVAVNIAPELILGGISRSHVDANVPASKDFDVYLQRDLSAYFAQRYGAGTSVTFELLREAPTHSGTAYPKFYLWISGKSESTTFDGAARVAAMNKELFK